MKFLRPCTTHSALVGVLVLAAACGDDDGPSMMGGVDGGIGPDGGGTVLPTPDLGDLMECSEAMPMPGELPDDPDDDDVAPAPPSVGADIPVTYFGPAPSDVNRNLIGPVQLLTAGTVDLDEGTVTLPLYEGRVGGPDGQLVWYVLTDTTDADNAAALGLNHSPKLAYADVGAAVRTGNYGLDEDGELVLIFDQGTVDFSPVRTVVPSPEPRPFPPAAGTQAGAVGDAYYSPLVRIVNAGDHVYNASMVSFGVDDDAFVPYCNTNVDDAGRMYLHDSVVRICPEGATDGSGTPYPNAGTVTLELVPGFSFGRPVLYLSMDTNAAGPAALEKAVEAPGLVDIVVGGDDSAFSAVERLFATVNGPSNDIPGVVNPQRQGFFSALRGEGGPLNVIGGIPTIATDYSPLWDINFGEWTQDAIDRGYRSRVTEEFQILGLVQRGFITGPEGSDYGSSGVIVNCPIVQRLL